MLDTSKFTKHPEGYKKSGEYTPKRVPIPLDVQSLVTAALPYDTRKQGDKPPKLDVFSQLVDLGYQSTQSRFRQAGGYEFTEDELQVPGITEDVIWLDKVVNDEISNILEAYNIAREAAGLKRLRGVVPIVCALLRRGAVISPKTTLT